MTGDLCIYAAVKVTPESEASIIVSNPLGVAPKYVHFDLCNRNDDTIVAINNDPLIEFNKINEFDKQLIDMNAKMKEQIHNNNIMLMIENTENKVENLFNDLINNN